MDLVLKWLNDLIAVHLMGRLLVNNNLHFDLFLTQNYQMALEDFKRSHMDDFLWCVCVLFVAWKQSHSGLKRQDE